MMSGSSTPNTSAELEQFTTQLDMSAQILMVDLSHVKPPYYAKEEMVGQMIYKFCHSSDRAQLQQHFEEGRCKREGVARGERRLPRYSWWIVTCEASVLCQKRDGWANDL